MHFSPNLLKAQFLRRYKRFLADVRLDSGEEITVHCPNTGSMTRCLVTESVCWLSYSSNPKRKYAYTLEWVTTELGFIACVNTHRANTLVGEAIAEGKIIELEGYDLCQAEVAYGKERSRIDFLLSRADERCYVEVKSVTLEDVDGRGFFPDAVSLRGQKHLRELIEVKQLGYRAVLLFCVQHSGIRQVSAAAHIDQDYANLLAEAGDKGVEILAYGTKFSPNTQVLESKLDVKIGEIAR